MMDRFGEKADTAPVDEDRFHLTTEVADDHVLYAWIFGFGGGKVKIETPVEVKNKYIKMLNGASKKAN